MMVMIPIRVREAQAAARQSLEATQHKIALDSEHNVVVVPDTEQSEIVARLREALIAEWRYLPQ
ncbi:hypothetical protein HY417_03270 [Candidatus Kaiserbacteria bacterium]|nr:hypothetical protein [Candidatus Kaiserbacteria bacterium]